MSSDPVLLTICVLAVIVAIWVVLRLYFIPYSVGRSRGISHTTLLFCANFLFGCSIFGWFIVLAYACAAESRKDREAREWRPRAQDRLLATSLQYGVPVTPAGPLVARHGRLDPPRMRR